MQLFYHPDCDSDTRELLFSKEESRHMTKVLRKRTGDRISLTNGKGQLFTVALIDDHIKQCRGEVVETKQIPPPSYRLHMAVAPTKNNDRFEWFLEKATEIGVTEITPLLCDHSERKMIKSERFKKILQTAMKQSLRCYLPVLHPLVSFSDFVTNEKEATLRMIAHCQEGPKQSLKQLVHPGDNNLILIGPEGDFSSKEIALATDANYTAISLGASRLRTETAAIVACQNIAFMNQ